MNNPNTMEQNERAKEDRLIAAFKQSIVQARTKREKGEATAVERTNSRVSVWEGESTGATLYLSGQRFTGSVDLTRDELLSVAAHCICAIEEVDKESLPHEIAEQEAEEAVKDLVRQPFPADDEQQTKAV